MFVNSKVLTVVRALAWAIALAISFSLAGAMSGLNLPRGHYPFFTTIKELCMKRRTTYHIVGGGPMGQSLTIETMDLARQLGHTIDIKLYERRAFGGSGHTDRVSAGRSQLWAHSGHLWAPTQPDVCLEVQQSIKRLEQLVPYAFSRRLALAIEQPNQIPSLAESFMALGVTHTEVQPGLFRQCYPAITLPDTRIYRVNDGVMDLRLLAHGLKLAAKARGVTLLDSGVRRLIRQKNRIKALIMDDGRVVHVAVTDRVVLANSAGIRPMLNDIGINVPGLKVVCSHLVGTDAFQLPLILAVSLGGPNMVFHDEFGNGVFNIFGNSARTVLPPETDGKSLVVDPAAVNQIRQEVNQWFGLTLPDHLVSWAARKVEIVPGAGIRSQSHNCLKLLDNLWMCLPGKISSSMAAASHAAKMMLRENIDATVARPVYETAPAQPPRRRMEISRRALAAAAAIVIMVVGAGGLRLLTVWS